MFKEQVCNFSTEEATIREVWMGKRCVSAAEERCLVVKEQTKWFFPLVPSSDFLPRTRRNEWMCFVFIYVVTTWNYLFVCFFFNRSVIVGPQLSMWQLHQREPKPSVCPDHCQMFIFTANSFLIKVWFLFFSFFFFLIKKKVLQNVSV